MSSTSTKFGRTAWTLVWESLGRSSAEPTIRNTFAFKLPFAQSRSISQYHVRKQCTGGLLLLGLDTSGPTSQTIVTSCNTVTESSIVGSCSRSGTVSRLARQAWNRSLHSPAGLSGNAQWRHKSTKAGEDSKTTGAPQNKPQNEPANKDPEAVKKAAEEGQHDSLTDSVSKYLHLPHLPKMPHRPTKEELLAAATGFWQRLKVRFKWFSIRSTRPFNADEWGAFLSWILFGHFVWILVGTTTFFSLLILMVNTVFAQETLARWIGDHLTKAAGVTVVFESAIVPKWGDGVITFRNVFVSRRPGQTKSSVSKGSPTDAAAAAAAISPDSQAAEDDGNYTQFDITISEVNVTLSFSKWWNSTGLLKDVEVKGVRGVVDRTSVHWSGEPRDPLSYRHESQPGDFEIEHFKLEDLLVTVHQPGGFRPFSVSIYSCELPQLRKHWLFYDFISASHMSGSFDGSLFTIHPKQVHGAVAGDEKYVADNLGEPSAWKKFSRLRIDGLKIDHLNRGVEGTFGWIYEGNVDIVADVMFPADPDESIGKVMSDFYDKMEDAVTSNRYLRILDKDISIDRNYNIIVNDVSNPTEGHLSSAPDNTTPEEPSSDSANFSQQQNPDDPPRYLVMDMRIHLNDVRAHVPMFHATPGISYVNQNLVRPIVAYINTKHTYIPINCRIVKRASDFDGSWTIFDSGLMDDLSAEVYSAFAADVEDQHSRVKRLKKVGFWAVSVALQALLVGVAGDLIT